MGIQNINTIDNLVLEVLEAIQYISKITEDSILSYLNNKGAHDIDDKSVIEILKQLQGKALINQLYRSIDAAITSKATHSTTSQSVIPLIAENHVHTLVTMILSLESMILLINLSHQ